MRSNWLMSDNEDDQNILKTDRDIFESLLRGDKITKLNSTSVEYICFDGDNLVDHKGKSATIYRLNSSDWYKIVGNTRGIKNE